MSSEKRLERAYRFLCAEENRIGAAEHAIKTELYDRRPPPLLRAAELQLELRKLSAARERLASLEASVGARMRSVWGIGDASDR